MSIAHDESKDLMRFTCYRIFSGNCLLENIQMMDCVFSCWAIKKEFHWNYSLCSQVVGMSKCVKGLKNPSEAPEAVLMNWLKRCESVLVGTEDQTVQSPGYNNSVFCWAFTNVHYLIFTSGGGGGRGGTWRPRGYQTVDTIRVCLSKFVSVKPPDISEEGLQRFNFYKFDINGYCGEQNRTVSSRVCSNRYQILFHEKSDHLQPWLWQQNCMFLRRLQDISSRDYSDKTGFL